MRLTIQQLEAMSTGELSDLLSNLVLLLRRLPDMPVSELGKPGPKMHEEEVNTTVQALLEKLPENYPPATFTKEPGGYCLVIDRTTIFRDASGVEAVKHTANYVNAREGKSPLPIGVIYGIYD